MNLLNRKQLYNIRKLINIKQVPKDLAKFGCLRSDEYYNEYCFTEVPINKEYNWEAYVEPISDVSIDNQNRLHSYNDKCAVKAEKASYWFKNGKQTKGK
jgi:hypothetical protein